MDLELYKEIVSNLSPDVILRHDVDVSLEAAVQIAEIDKELGRESKFYLMHHSEYYNLRANMQVVIKLLNLGHTVGAHIHSLFTKDLHSLEGSLKEFYRIYDYTGFTFHLNNEHSAQFQRHSYCGVKNDNLCPDGYTSDARGIMPKIPTKGVLNLHPEWWVYPGKTPQEKLEYYFNQQYQRCLKEILPD